MLSAQASSTQSNIDEIQAITAADIHKDNVDQVIKNLDVDVDSHKLKDNEVEPPEFNGLWPPCYSLASYKRDYKRVIQEITAGVIVSFAQVPESMSFALIGHLPPIFGLHSAWIVGGWVALTGGRPGMISGATGGTGAVLAPLMLDPELGINYLPYIVIFSGILITLFGMCGVAKFARLIPQTVMIGFLNGLAIIILMGQFHLFQHTHDNVELALCVVLSLVTFAVVHFLPKLTKVIPSSLAGIAVCSILEYVVIRLAFHHHTPLINDLHDISGDWPLPFWADDTFYDNVPSLKDGETWQKLIIPIILVTLVSIVEDCMTMDVVTDLTATKSKHLERHTTQQQVSMGIANIFTGIFPAMGGHGAIGLSMVSCHSGSSGVYRISGLIACVCTFTIVMFASPLIGAVPAAALVGIMFTVVFHTFEWQSIVVVFTSFFPRKMRNTFPKDLSSYKIKRGNAFVILVVTIMVVVVNLAYAVVIGILLSCLLYTWQSGFDFFVYKEWIPKPHMKNRTHYHPHHHKYREDTLDADDSLNIPEFEPDEEHSHSSSGGASIFSNHTTHTHHSHHSYKAFVELNHLSDDEEVANQSGMSLAESHLHINVGIKPKDVAVTAKAKDADYAAVAVADDDDLNVDHTSSTHEEPQNLEGITKKLEEFSIVDPSRNIEECLSQMNLDDDYTLVYHFEGPLFFGNCRNLLDYFTPEMDPDVIEIHLRDSYIYDFSAMNALNAIGEEYKTLGKKVHLKHINMKSHRLITKAHSLVKYFTYEHEDISANTSRSNDDASKLKTKSLIQLTTPKQFRFGKSKRFV